VLGLIAEVTGESAPVTSGDAADLRLSDDLHLDSLGRVQLQTLMERRLGLEMDDDALAAHGRKTNRLPNEPEAPRTGRLAGETPARITVGIVSRRPRWRRAMIPGMSSFNRTLSEMGGTATMIQGLGQRAGWSNGVLAVLQNQLIFKLKLSGTQAEMLNASEALARKVLTNMQSTASPRP